MSKNRVDEIFDLILKNGGDVDTVANELMDDLNAALAKWNDGSKLRAAQDVADHFNKFISEYYPDTNVTYTGKMIIEAMEFGSKFSKVKDLDDAVNMFCESLERIVPKNEVKRSKTLEEMINEKGW